MMQKAWSNIEEVSCCFSWSSVKFRGHTGQKNRQFLPQLRVSGLQLQFEFTDTYNIIIDAWSNLEEAPHCFSRSSIKFRGHTGQKKITDFVFKFQVCKGQNTVLIRNERFRTANPVRIHWWLWNDAQSLKQQRRDALLFFNVIRQNWGHTGHNIADFEPNWAFSDCNSSLNSEMNLKWFTKLGIV